MQHRYWRFRCLTANNNSQLAIAELQFRDVAGQVMTYSGVAFASSSYGDGSLNPDKAFDGNADTAWGCASGNAVGQWIAYDFGDGNDKEIVEITVQARGSASDNNQAPASGAVEYSDDSNTWATKWSPEFGAFNLGETKTSDTPAGNNSAAVPQLAIVIPAQEVVPPSGGSELGQVAIVCLAGETPLPSGGATLAQLAIVTLNVEYTLPNIPQQNLIRAIWGFPLLIQ